MGKLLLIVPAVGLCALVGSGEIGRMTTLLYLIGGIVVLYLIANLIFGITRNNNPKESDQWPVTRNEKRDGFTSDGRPYVVLDTYQGSVAVVKERSGKVSAYGMKHGAFEVSNLLARGTQKEVSDKIKSLGRD